MDLFKNVFGLSYFGCSESDGYVYSCDMVRIHFAIKQDSNDLEKYLQAQINKNINFEYFGPCLKSLKYRHLFSLKYSENCIASLGLSFNGFSREDSLRGFIEFNPNKLARCKMFWADLFFISSYWVDSYVKRFDLAIDIPIKREFSKLVKDKRKYSCVRKSDSDFTEYLGNRNDNGFVKLYNKTLESGLLVDISRLEITIDLDYWDEFFHSVPLVRLCNNQKSIINSDGLSSTQYAFARCLQDSDNPDFYLKMIQDCRTRKKIADSLNDFSVLKIDLQCCSEVYLLVKHYFDNIKNISEFACK